MAGQTETTITSKNRVSLPVASLRELGWQSGDRLIVQVMGDGMMVLMRRPDSWTETFSGKLGDVFGDHDDTLAYLDGERASWSEHTSTLDRDAFSDGNI